MSAVDFKSGRSALVAHHEILTEDVRASFLEMSPELRADDAWVKEELTRAVRSAFKQRVGRRPTVLPLIVRL